MTLTMLWAKGWTNSKTWRAWKEARQRCENPRNKNFGDYGGRGIKVCEAWSSFSTFLRDVGPCPPGHEADRIDVDGDYEPGNIRWVKKGCGRRRSDVLVSLSLPFLTIHEATLSELADLFEIPSKTLYARLRAGCSASELVRPLQQRRRGQNAGQSGSPDVALAILDTPFDNYGPCRKRGEVPIQ